MLFVINSPLLRLLAMGAVKDLEARFALPMFLGIWLAADPARPFRGPLSLRHNAGHVAACVSDPGRTLVAPAALVS